MKKIVFTVLICSFFISCHIETPEVIQKSRNIVDTIGFANNAIKMDSVVLLIERQFGELIQQKFEKNNVTDSTKWKTVICPHDDYAYANYLYPLSLKNMKAKTIIMFGVAHKAKNFNLDNQLVFGNFDSWKSAYGNVQISALQKEIIRHLEKDSYIVHDSMQIVEHSLEAIVPFLQYYNRNVEIVPILVPYMSFERNNVLAEEFSKVLNEITQNKNLKWGDDFAIVISSDAVHYGDEDWGDSNFAFMGADSAGYIKATDHEMEIISNCLTGKITPGKIKQFTEYTVQPDDYKQYKWTSCGRYSIPFGLMLSYNLGQMQKIQLDGKLLSYSTSIAEKNPDFTDIGMGVTAIANIRHWVGYAAIGY